jgi:hypothetical protein
MSGKLETIVMQSQVSGESKRGSGLGEEEEEKVGVVSECNTTPSSDWLIPLSHSLIHVHVGVLAEDTAASISRFAVVTCEVESTDVMPPTAEAGFKGVAPPFVQVQWVCFPHALGTPRDPLPTLLIPALVTLLGEVTVRLHEVVAPTGVAGAEMAAFSWLSRRIGRGGVGRCVHVIGSSDEGGFWGWG